MMQHLSEYMINICQILAGKMGEEMAGFHRGLTKFFRLLGYYAT
jgi:hypothetical protein